MHQVTTDTRHTSLASALLLLVLLLCLWLRGAGCIVGVLSELTLPDPSSLLGTLFISEHADADVVGTPTGDVSLRPCTSSLSDISVSCMAQQMVITNQASCLVSGFGLMSAL